MGETIIRRKVVARVNTAITLGSRSPRLELYDCKTIPTIEVSRSQSIKLPSCPPQKEAIRKPVLRELLL